MTSCVVLDLCMQSLGVVNALRDFDNGGGVYRRQCESLVAARC